VLMGYEKLCPECLTQRPCQQVPIVKVFTKSAAGYPDDFFFLGEGVGSAEPDLDFMDLVVDGFESWLSEAVVALVSRATKPPLEDFVEEVLDSPGDFLFIDEALLVSLAAVFDFEEDLAVVEGFDGMSDGSSGDFLSIEAGSSGEVTEDFFGIEEGVSDWAVRFLDLEFAGDFSGGSFLS
jgi:hypothetical protein